MFIIYVNDIPDMSSRSVRLSQFSDDLEIWTHAANVKLGKTNLSKALNLLKPGAPNGG